MGPSRVSELSSLIATHTAKIDAYLDSRDLPSPTFEPEQPLNVFSDEAIAISRQAIFGSHRRAPCVDARPYWHFNVSLSSL